MKKQIPIITCLIFLSFNLLADKKDTVNLIKINRLEIQIESNKNDLINLRNQNDSLKNKLNYIINSDYKSFEVIDKVYSYYDNAWTKLIYLISALGGIMVFVIPIALNRLQRRELKLNKEDFQEYVDTKIIEFEQTIKSHNEEKIKEFSAEIEKNHKTEIDKLYAMTFFIQGVNFNGDKGYKFAIKSFVRSLSKQISSKTNKNITNTFSQITIALKELQKSQTKLSDNLIKELTNSLETVSNEYPGEYEELIEEIKKII